MERSAQDGMSCNLTVVSNVDEYAGNEEEAFFAETDYTIGTEDYVDNGRVIVVIGTAAVRPPEFVMFRIA
jgi:phage tail sheath protein FI